MILSSLGSASGTFIGCLFFTDAMDPFHVSISFISGILIVSSSAPLIPNPGLPLFLSTITGFLSIWITARTSIVSWLTVTGFLKDNGLSLLMHVFPGILGIIIAVLVDTWTLFNFTLIEV